MKLFPKTAPQHLWNLMASDAAGTSVSWLYRSESEPFSMPTVASLSPTHVLLYPRKSALPGNLPSETSSLITLFRAQWVTNRNTDHGHGWRHVHCRKAYFLSRTRRSRLATTHQYESLRDPIENGPSVSVAREAPLGLSQVCTYISELTLRSACPTKTYSHAKKTKCGTSSGTSSLA